MSCVVVKRHVVCQVSSTKYRETEVNYGERDKEGLLFLVAN
jgi:hypothetical protein